MIVFLCHTGLRIGEMTALRVSDVFVNSGPRDEMFISHKIGTKTKCAYRVVPLNHKAQECVSKLLEFNRMRGFPNKPESPLFPWKNHEKLPVREAEREIQKLREAAGLSDKITPHAFRHYFGTKLGQSGTDGYTLMTLMGHASLDATQIYLGTSNELRRKAVNTLSQRRVS
jgi:integrase/recombinase XerC